MTEYLPYVSLAIALLGLLINYISFQNEKIKNKNEIQFHLHDLDSKLKVLEERVNNEIKTLDKLDEKMETLLNDR